MSASAGMRSSRNYSSRSNVSESSQKCALKLRATFLTSRLGRRGSSACYKLGLRFFFR